jgi:uncharacterized protein YjbI with pentapeptide repeats
MANPDHVKILRQGAAAWNAWRQERIQALPPHVRENGSALLLRTVTAPDLRGADLSCADLRGADLVAAHLEEANLVSANLSAATLYTARANRANFWNANLTKANLSYAFLTLANLSAAVLNEADLTGSFLSGAILTAAKLRGATLKWTKLNEAHLFETDLTNASLAGAVLAGAVMIRTDLSGADLRGCFVYGVSAWDLKMDADTRQENLIVGPADKPFSTVGNIKLAQFIYLLLDSKEIRDSIDTITSKIVLILGRFSNEQKPILDAIQERLRATRPDYVPIMFDFAQPRYRDTVETVTTLARLARFVVADLTDARSVLQELEAIVPHLPSVAFRFIIKSSQREYGMLDHIRRYPWVIQDTYEYTDCEEVTRSIEEKIIDPAEAKVRELQGRS